MPRISIEWDANAEELGLAEELLRSAYAEWMVKTGQCEPADGLRPYGEAPIKIDRR